MIRWFCLSVLMALVLAGCGVIAPSYRDTAVTMTAQADFDPERYLGRWYEVARFANPFQARCAGAIAEYTPGPDATISVRNICLDAQATAIDEITGTARVVAPGRLSVRFAGVPFAGPYWVLWVDDGYRTAVVGAPNGRVGWVLHRDPTIPESSLATARAVLAANGYDISQLNRSVTP